MNQQIPVSQDEQNLIQIPKKPEETYSTLKLWLYVLSLSLGSVQLGYGLGVYNAINKVLMKIYSVQCKNCWSYEEQKQEPFNTIVSTALFIGGLLGSIASTCVIKRSRILALLLSNIFCVIGSLMQLIVSLPSLIIGRFIQGFGVGGFANLIPMMINQVSPPNVRGKTGTIVFFMIHVAILSTPLMVLGFPQNVKDVQSNTHYNMLWRVIIGAPVMIGVLIFVLFLTCYNYDTPIKYLQRGQLQLGLKALQKVYKNETAALDRLHQIQRQHCIQNSIKTQEKLNDTPKVVIVISVIFSAYQQLTGTNGITFYSAQIFEDSLDKGDIYKGNMVVVWISIVSLVSPLIAFILIQHSGRRFLFLIGTLLMSILMLLTGLFKYHNQLLWEKICILAFKGTFALSMGSVFWAYLPEIMNSSAMSLCISTYWITIVTISLSVPALENLKEWMFFIFAIVNLIGFFFTMFFIIESKGKTRGEVQHDYMLKFARGSLEQSKEN